MPSAGSTTAGPQVGDDNRDASISDDGKYVAFVSNRNLATNNTDFNPEIFRVDVTVPLVFTQVTNTVDMVNIPAGIYNPIFSSNPSLSGDGSALAFISNGNLAASNDDGGGIGNPEVYLASFSGNTVTGVRQVTKTKDSLDSNGNRGATCNVFSFGRRLSRDGRYIAFESLANDPKANGTNGTAYVSFVYDSGPADLFTQLGPRATDADLLHFPVFTDYTGNVPGSVMFTSGLNFNPDGSFPTAELDSTGLNPLRAAQLFLAPIPVATTGPFTRITNNPRPLINIFVGIRGFASSSRRRIAFSLPATELGGGNSDLSNEVYYQLSPTITTVSPGSISLLTGASLISVVMPSPTPSPSVTPSPSPSPSPTGSPTPYIAPGLAPGELGVAQSSVSLAPSSASNNNGSESGRSTALPIELNGVSVAINGAACGLYSVSSTEIRFVVPVGLIPNTGSTSYPIVINIHNDVAATGTVIRGLVVVVSAQPDVGTSTNGPGGRARVCNITNPSTPSTTCISEPFNVTTDDGTGTQVATVLRVLLTGVRGTASSAASVVVGTTAIVPNSLVSTDMPGVDQIDFTLPSTVDRGDIPIVVKVGTASSRPTDTSPPHITINGTPAPNPITNTDFFVREHYLDFLGREPDSSGFAFWTNNIAVCGTDPHCIEVKRIDTSAAFFLSIEFQQTGYLVERLYKTSYGDVSGNSTYPNSHTLMVPVIRLNEFQPDTQAIGNGVVVGQSGWQNALEANKVAFISAFVQRSRFTTDYPVTLTPAQFVTRLNTNIGSLLTAPEQTNAIARFGGATDTSNTAARALALRDVAENATFSQQGGSEFNRAFVLIQYFGYLRRDPNSGPDADHTGYDFWLGKLNQFNGNYVQAEMVKSFLVSKEYRLRFGQ